MKVNFSPMMTNYNMVLINVLKTNRFVIVLSCSLSIIGYITLPYLEKYHKQIKNESKETSKEKSKEKNKEK
tara:strand:- start:10246 stop:10458 length:213 start_codon:yes stop_codon:yes gene_type:complete